MEIESRVFPCDQERPDFLCNVVDVFCQHRQQIKGIAQTDGRKSDAVLATLCDPLVALGFQVEKGKSPQNKIPRSIYCGADGRSELHYELDAWHEEWKAALEIQSSRAVRGNAIYKDFVKGLLIADMEYLVLAVRKEYHYGAKRRSVSRDYETTLRIAKGLYEYSRKKMPFELCVIGY